VTARHVFRTVLRLIGHIVVFLMIVGGFMFLIPQAEVLAKVGVLVIVGAIFWIVALLATLRLTRRSH
jgi:hypothetical protein